MMGHAASGVLAACFVLAAIIALPAPAQSEPASTLSAGLPGGVLRSMWATPVLITRPSDSARVVSEDARQSLVEAAVKAHSYAVRAQAGAGEGANDAFFHWQQRALRGDAGEQLARDIGAAALLPLSDEMRALRTLAAASAVQLLRSAGLEAHEAVARLLGPDGWRHVTMWAGVHSHGTGHGPHVHKNSLVSGSYYAQVPAAAADSVNAAGGQGQPEVGLIEFSDPRGPLPPFERRMDVAPRQGMVVVFPGWLVHRVTPTMNTAAATTEADAAAGSRGAVHRVAFSFNVDGVWEDTTDVNAEFKVPRLDAAGARRVAQAAQAARAADTTAGEL